MKSVDVLEPIRKERERQKAERAKRKAARGSFSLLAFLKTWFFRLLYTFFLLMIVYIMVVGCTVMIPFVMGFIIGSFGYTISNNAEMLLALLSGMFFTGWVFLISFGILKISWKQYIKNIKETLPESVAKKLDNLS